MKHYHQYMSTEVDATDVCKACGKGYVVGTRADSDQYAEPVIWVDGTKYTDPPHTWVTVHGRCAK